MSATDRPTLRAALCATRRALAGGVAMSLLSVATAANASPHSDDVTDADATSLDVRIAVQTGFGVGLRFDNPYRLATPLGQTAESVSRTASYFDLGVRALFGDPFGLVHGPTLRFDVAAQGVGQQVFTPSYGIAYRAVRWELSGRAGVPILLSPNVNAGLEGAVGGAFFLLSGIGLRAELIGDTFTGASTPSTKRPLYPVLSGELGIVIEWEKLP